MTPVEERLSELMHEAVPSMAGVSFDDVARRARHRRRARLASVAVAALIIIAAVTGVALALVGRNGQDVQRVTTTPTPTPTISGPSVPPGATAGADANHRYCYYRAPASGTPPRTTDDWCFGTRQELDSYASSAAGRNDDSNPSLSVNPPNATPHPTDGASRGTG
jgi:hypothetical protein